MPVEATLSFVGVAIPYVCSISLMSFGKVAVGVGCTRAVPRMYGAPIRLVVFLAMTSLLLSWYMAAGAPGCGWSYFDMLPVAVGLRVVDSVCLCVLLCACACVVWRVPARVPAVVLAFSALLLGGSLIWSHARGSGAQAHGSLPAMVGLGTTVCVCVAILLGYLAIRRASREHHRLREG